jgi:hypothetical protein
MADMIYVVDPDTNEPTPIKPVALSALGVRERSELERWVVGHPELLGEPLFVVTTEYDRFDKSDRRLDILALDRQGTLVVIELKLDTTSSFADLQAIRYAAFCSTMTSEDLVGAHAEWKKCGTDEAKGRIEAFLEVEEIPQIGDRPRIILAAGSMDDQELTSTVLWLRGSGIDITCVELTPYRVAPAKTILIVPRVIIPLPEARDYLVKVEQKEAARAQSTQQQAEFRKLWQPITDAFNKTGLAVDGREFRPSGSLSARYVKITTGIRHVHYEWVFRTRSSAIDCALHFEDDNKETNLRWLAAIQANEASIRGAVDFEFSAAEWGEHWAEVRFRVPYEPGAAISDLAPTLASVMATLIRQTYPILRSHAGKE